MNLLPEPPVPLCHVCGAGGQLRKLPDGVWVCRPATLCVVDSTRSPCQIAHEEMGDVLTPELDKMAKVAVLSQIVGEFLDWLEEKGIHLASRHVHDDDCYNDDNFRDCGAHADELLLAMRGKKDLLAEFFDIDLKAVEKEKRALLKVLRERNQS